MIDEQKFSLSGREDLYGASEWRQAVAIGISERQQRILEFIREYIEEHTFPPTIREIGRQVGISSTSVVKYNLESLQRKGYIVRSGDISRGIRLVDGAIRSDIQPAPEKITRLVRVPKGGLVAASTPIPAEAQQDKPFGNDDLVLSDELVPDSPDLIALRVKGDSLIDALVCDGDWIVLRRQTTAQPHDMVALWLKDREETTLKYYIPEGDIVRLQPANTMYEPMRVPASAIEIQGKIIVVIRPFS